MPRKQSHAEYGIIAGNDFEVRSFMAAKRINAAKGAAKGGASKHGADGRVVLVGTYRKQASNRFETVWNDFSVVP